MKIKPNDEGKLFWIVILIVLFGDSCLRFIVSRWQVNQITISAYEAGYKKGHEDGVRQGIQDATLLLLNTPVPGLPKPSLSLDDLGDS